MTVAKINFCSGLWLTFTAVRNLALFFSINTHHFLISISVCCQSSQSQELNGIYKEEKSNPSFKARNDRNVGRVPGRSLTVNEGDDERAVCEPGSISERIDRMDQRTKAWGITNMKKRWVRWRIVWRLEVPHYSHEDPYGIMDGYNRPSDISIFKF